MSTSLLTNTPLHHRLITATAMAALTLLTSIGTAREVIPECLAEDAVLAALAEFPNDKAARQTFIDYYCEAALDGWRYGRQSDDATPPRSILFNDAASRQGYFAGLKARAKDGSPSPLEFGYLIKELRGTYRSDKRHISEFKVAATGERFHTHMGPLATLPESEVTIRAWVSPEMWQGFGDHSAWKREIIAMEVLAVDPHELAAMEGKTIEQLTPDQHNIVMALTNETLLLGRLPLWHTWKHRMAETEHAQPDCFAMLHTRGDTRTSHARPRIYLMNPDGKMLGWWEYPCDGTVLSASTAFDEKLQMQIITIQTKPGELDPIGKPSKTQVEKSHRQHFAVAEGKMYRVRIEDEEGHLIRSHYFAPAFTDTGLSKPAKNLTEWSALLASPHLPQRLTALALLGGVHLQLKDLTPDTDSTVIEYAEMARSLHRLDSTKKLLEEYANSNNTHLRDAATMAKLANFLGEGEGMKSK